MLLVEFKELFAWKSSDMPGISKEVISHELNLDPNIRLITQKRHPVVVEKVIAIRQEVGKLVEAQFVKEIKFQTWVANPVLGTWKMSIDFRDLNKACPKDSYPLPRIDQLVNDSSSHELLSVMDAYSGFNQVQINDGDAQHAAFYTDSDIYHYMVMSFGIINAGATYQMMVNKLFSGMIGVTMEAYVDDMLIKSVYHVKDLRKTFERMLLYQVRLNPAKCAFGVQLDKFLGYMVSQRGIEVNPEKLDVIEAMKSPTCHKEVQSLNGRLAVLSRFLKKAEDKSLPFFQVLRANKKVEWMSECEKDFQDLKQHIRTVPQLVKPSKGDALSLYLSITHVAVSSVFVKEVDKGQAPVYYVSKVLAKAEINYLEVMKYLYALVISFRKLRPYFHEHEITVLTNQPLKHFLHKPDASGRMVKWVIELSVFQIKFSPRTAIKGQALTYFIVESTCPPPVMPIEKEEDDRPLILHTDSSSSVEGSGAGLILTSPDGGTPLRYALVLTFKATNNDAEYEALLTSLRLPKGLGIASLHMYCDIQLVVNQIKGEYVVKAEKMKLYRKDAKALVE